MTPSPQSRPHAPFAARLLAFTLGVGALFDLLSFWAQRRAFAAAEDAEGWDSRERMFGTLEVLHDGGFLFMLLLAGIAVFAALRYRRDLGDSLTRNLALGTAVCLGLDALRQIAQAALITFSSPMESGSTPAEWTAYIQLWYRVGALLSTAALTLTILMAARAERLITGRLPNWALVTGALFAASVIGMLALMLGDFSRDPFDGLGLRDFLYLLLPIATFAIAVGLVIHAGRVSTDEPAAWTRAAAGVGRYKHATALRLLLVVVAVAVVVGRSGPSPLMGLGTLCALGFAAVVTGVFQVVGLVRLADALAPRGALAVALPLLGLGLAFECVALTPIAWFVYNDGKNASRLRLDNLADNLAEVGMVSQGLGILTAIALLLALRAVASSRGATAVVRRCTTLLITLLIVIVVLGGTFYKLPDPRLDHNAVETILLVGGFGLLITAIWILVSYFRTLSLLQEALTRTPSEPGSIRTPAR